MPKLADPNLIRCATCNARLSERAEYHPYAFCVLVKAGLNPLTVVLDAVRALKLTPGPEAIEPRNQAEPTSDNPS